MKKLIFLFAAVAFILTGCSQDENQDIPAPEKTISGSFDEDQFPYTIDLDGTQVTFRLMEEGTETIETRVSAGPVQYATTKMTQTTSKPVKTVVNFPPYQGIYFCNQFHFGNVINLPENVAFVDVFMPNPLGYKVISTAERGVNYFMSTVAGGKKLDIWFYTIRLEYDTAGRQFSVVAPIDGRTVRVPYQIYYR